MFPINIFDEKESGILQPGSVMIFITIFFLTFILRNWDIPSFGHFESCKSGQVCVLQKKIKLTSHIPQVEINTVSFHRFDIEA